MKLGFFDGMRYPLVGLKHLLDHRELWPHALKSLVVGLILFIVLAVAVAILLFDVPEKILEEGLEAKTLFFGCLSISSGIAAGIVVFALIGNVVAGPYLEALTEKMMADAGRLRETPRGYWMAFWSGLGNQICRFLLFVAVQIGFLWLWLTPGAFVQPLVGWAAAVFFVAIEHLEYPLEARSVAFFDRINWSMKRLMPVLGFGTTLFFVMPMAGFLFLPAAVCGAVLLEQELEKVSPIPGGTLNLSDETADGR